MLVHEGKRLTRQALILGAGLTRKRTGEALVENGDGCVGESVRIVAGGARGVACALVDVLEGGV